MQPTVAERRRNLMVTQLVVVVVVVVVVVKTDKPLLQTSEIEMSIRRLKQ